MPTDSGPEAKRRSIETSIVEFRFDSRRNPGSRLTKPCAPGVALADIGFENGEGLRKRFDAKPRFVNTVLADDFIVATASSDAHNNVANPTCGKLVAAAITTGLS